MQQDYRLCSGEWRNWYTRTTQNRVPNGLRVRFPPRPPRIGVLKQIIDKGSAMAGLASFAVDVNNTSVENKNLPTNKLKELVCGIDIGQVHKAALED